MRESASGGKERSGPSRKLFRLQKNRPHACIGSLSVRRILKCALSREELDMEGN